MVAYPTSGSSASAEVLNNEPFDWTSSASIAPAGSSCGNGFTGYNGGANYVKAVQLLMYADGTYGPGTARGGSIDGLWGNKSHNGMREWQSAHGLGVDGCFGPASANNSQLRISPDGGLTLYTYDGSRHDRNYHTFIAGDGKAWEEVHYSVWISYAGCTPAGANCTVW
jgi:peptidoglycan hydrolase-like protein with peptidoglycan-binding domain